VGGGSEKWDAPRRIPIGADHPELVDKGGEQGGARRQEAYSGEEEVDRFPVLMVSEDGSEIRVAAPNDGRFLSGPARLVLATAGGGTGYFQYESAVAVSEAASGGGPVTPSTPNP